MATRRTQAERRDATRAALLAAARKLFADRGYEAVGTEEIVGEAGVTRGALYHHFEDKRDLFAGVLEQVEEEFVAGLSLDLDADPYVALVSGIDQFLDASLDTGVQRITLIDAPAVLGWEQWHEFERRYGLGLIEAGLQAAIDAGQIRELPVPELAVSIFGSLIECALRLARADDPKSERARVAEVLKAQLEGLRIDWD